MNDDQINFQNCAHCGVRLYANATSSLCKSCRFQGHKEFGVCDKCPKEKKLPPLKSTIPNADNLLGDR